MNWLTVLRSRGFLLVMLPLLWAVAYLPTITARDLRLEEGRRATPAAEMLRSGDWVVPTLYGEKYLSKPPGFFWVVAEMGKVQGRVSELSVRIPSVLSVLLGAWLLLAIPGIRWQVRAMAALMFMSMPTMLDKGTLGEIDALLSLVTFAAVVLWWRSFDVDSGKVALWGWIGAGLLLGISVLMKGPGGLAEFYAVVAGGLFVIGRGKWRALLPAGHAIMLALAILPVALWVKTLLARTGMTWGELLTIWSHQTGADMVAGKGGAKWSKLLVDHYVMFPLKVFSDLLPWAAIGVAGMFAWRKAEVQGGAEPQEGRGSVLWKLMGFGWLVMLAAFWLWPKANPRYVMMGAYPMAILAAIAVARWDVSRSIKVAGFLRSAGKVMGLAMGILCGASIMLAHALNPSGMVLTCCIVAVAFVVMVWAYWLTKRTPMEGAAVAFACNLALLILLGSGMLMSVWLPVKARTDATRIVHRQIEEIVPRDRPIYTRRIFTENADCYNEQFYLPQPAKALRDFNDLPVGTTVTVILLPEEWDRLLAVAPNAKKIGVLDARKKGAALPMIVAEVTRQ